MEAMIHYLTKNPDIVGMVKQGMVSLLGVTKEEEKAIIQSFDEINVHLFYWC